MNTRSWLLVPIALLLPTGAFADEPVRVVAWNVQTVGAPGTTQYEAALDVLDRLGADVVAMCEIASSADVGYFGTLASDAGYAYQTVAAAGPFGALRCGVLSHLEIVAATAHDAASLSGDTSANDLTRYLLEVEVDVTGAGDPLTVVTTHWKSGTGNDDEFRRAVESLRMEQVLSAFDPASDAYLVLGDVNEEIDSTPRSPAVFTAVPSGMPTSWSLGSDLAVVLGSTGIDNDPFLPLERIAIELPALQLDGSDATRPSSGRRLDYAFVSDALWDNGVAYEVYDSADEGLSGGVAKYGTAPPSSTCTDASDHYPVLADVLVPTGGGSTNVAPVSDAGGPYSASTGAAITLDGTGSTDSDGTVVSYAWDFGDGTSGSGVSPSHAWTSAGTYTVGLTVTDDDGASHTDTATVTVTTPSACTIAIGTAEYASKKRTLTVFATSSDSGATLTAWGDGSLLGTMTAKKGKTPGFEYKARVTSPPSSVSVTSDCGGSDTAAVVTR